MKTHLITYGDAKYNAQLRFFKETAAHAGFFDLIDAYSATDIGPDFYREFKDVLNLRRGGGYWIWKPYFIKRKLEEIEEGDVLIYCDGGCMINSRGHERFKEYVRMVQESELGIISFELPHLETAYTKREVFDYFGSQAELENTNQLMATIVILKKCAHTQMLVDIWYNTLVKHRALFTDEMDEQGQAAAFIDHRHDQSIFSIIRKKFGSIVIPDETYFLDFVREGQLYPLWATRLR